MKLIQKLINWKGEVVIATQKEIYQSLTNGTSNQGHIIIDYSKIVKVFGPENFNADDSLDNKVQAEWLILTPAGVATIYNYKTGKNI